MGDALVLWIHILAAAIFVGAQVFLFVAAVPAMRTIEDVQQRTRATRTLTTRFGWIAGGALVVLVARPLSALPLHATVATRTAMKRRASEKRLSGTAFRL